MIEFREVHCTFSGDGGESIEAVRGLSLRIETGELHCLLGTSGCGKTTTLKTVNRLVEASAGTILLDHEDVRSQHPIELRRRIGYVIQSGGLFPHMTVARNIGLPCELAGWTDAKRRSRVAELMQWVHLAEDEFAQRHPAELSGGQAQRVGVARALATDPRHLLMDEPFGALDPITRRQVQDEFAMLQRQLGKTVLMVTHDVEEAFRLADRVSVMSEGKILQTGTPSEMRERPADDFVRDFVQGSGDGHG